MRQIEHAESVIRDGFRIPFRGMRADWLGRCVASESTDVGTGRMEQLPGWE
jgi:hypothetical protein